MADFPPNPEDGELWLPSDIIHEITSAKFTPPNNTLFHHNSTTTDFTIPSVAPNFENCFGSFSAKLNENGGIVDDPSSASQVAVPAPISLCYNPFTPPKSLQGSEDKGSVAYVESYGGTGVFLPPLVNTAEAYKKAEEIRSGTGGFLHQSKPAVTAHQKKLKRSKNEVTLRRIDEKIKCSIKEETLGKIEQSQHPYEIGLPNDWTY